MEQITLTSYAKINLTLSVTGKRADGYHTLESVMQEISLADTVQMKRIPQGIQLSCTDPSLPTDEKNLCFKAAARYLSEAKIEGGVRIHLIKNIPHGAGMGGGSSNAAAVLKGMLALYPATLPMEELALSLGADVPFFLSGKTGFCEGIGEKVSRAPFLGKKSLWCVTAKNCPGLSTPEIYSAFDRMDKTERKRIKKEEILSAMKNPSPLPFFDLMHNDLELPAIALRPEIAELKALLLELGADAAMMTGSGSAVFGLFTQREKAKECANILSSQSIRADFCTLL